MFLLTLAIADCQGQPSSGVTYAVTGLDDKSVETYSKSSAFVVKDAQSATDKSESIPTVTTSRLENHVGAVVREAAASAVALGSMVVFQKKDMGVLVNFPEPARLEAALP